MLIWWLQILVSAGFFAQKLYVLLGKKFGWGVGVAAAILGIFYCYLVGWYVYAVLDAGLVVIMGYAYYAQPEKNPRVENAIRLVVGVVMSTLTIFVFSGLMTIIEFGSSVGLLVGTYCLTQCWHRSGWALYFVAHIFGAILGIHKDQQIFADLQIASAVVSLVGIARNSR